MPGIFDSDIFDSGFFDTGPSGDGRYLAWGPDPLESDRTMTQEKTLQDPMNGSTLEVIDHIGGILQKMMGDIERRRQMEMQHEKQRVSGEFI